MFIVYYIETISYEIRDGRRVREDKGRKKKHKPEREMSEGS